MRTDNKADNSIEPAVQEDKSIHNNENYERIRKSIINRCGPKFGPILFRHWNIAVATFIVLIAVFIIVICDIHIAPTKTVTKEYHVAQHGTIHVTPAPTVTKENLVDQHGTNEEAHNDAVKDDDNKADNNIEPAVQEDKSIPAKEDNYLEVTSPEDMKKDAIRDVNILFNALEKVTINDIKSPNINEYCYYSSWNKEYPKDPFVAKLSSESYRNAVRSIKQRELNIPANRISNNVIVERMLNDIRFTAAKINHGSSKWQFSRFDDNIMVPGIQTTALR